MTKEIKYFTVKEQIEHLKSKGLVIPSTKNARRYLRDIGYYVLINGYKRPFTITQPDGIKEYVRNTSIDDLYHLYFFDKSLRELLLRNLNTIEVTVKARMSDLISRKYGVRDSEYLNPANFKPDDTSPKSKRLPFIDLHAQIQETISRQKGKHKSVQHYSKNYGFYPFWVVANILSFGTIGHLYAKLKQPDQNEIALSFGIKPDLLESALIVMHLFRNVCAHNEVTYNYRTRYSIKQKEIEDIYKLLKIKKDEHGKYIHGVNDLFCIMILLKLMLPDGFFSNFFNQFKSIINNLKKKVAPATFQSIIYAMGLPKNYEKLKDSKT